jgi:ubiquinone/menaquinone biosynthesis C-methylase UbiE
VPAEDGPSWSDIAGWYDDLIEAGSGPHEMAVETLLALVPPLAGLTVLDVACGTGLATRALATAGAETVTGTDSSAAMLDRARSHGGGDDATYVVDDAQTLATFADSSVDGVTCQLALMDIPDLDRALAAVHRVLRPGGWFVFVIAHPCFLGRGAGPTVVDGRPAVVVPEYLEERFWRSANPQGVRRAGQHHRTVSTYLNALVTAGFALEEVVEPRASALLAEQQPLYAVVPLLLAARVRTA